MALRTPPSWLQNGSHPAENDRLTTKAIYNTTGIIGSSSLQVTPQGSPNMTVNVATGWAAIVSSTANAGTYVAYNDATTVLTIGTADPSLPRIDKIVVTVNDAFYSGASNNVVFAVVAGSPNASPVVPSTPSNSIALATIAVAAGATTIVAGNITDTRVLTTTNLPVLSLSGGTLTGALVVGGNLTANGNFAANSSTLTATATTNPALVVVPLAGQTSNTLSIADASSNTLAGFDINGTFNTVQNDATKYPIKLRSTGTLLATGVGGAVEYDQKVAYLTPSSTATLTTNGGRAVIPASHFYSLTGTRNLTGGSTSAQSVFGVGFATAASTTYEIDMMVQISFSVSVPTVGLILTLAQTGGATTTSVTLFAERMTTNTTGFTALTPVETATYSSSGATNAATGTYYSASATSAHYTQLRIRGFYRSLVAGTITPQVTFSSSNYSSPVVQQNNYIKLTPIGSNTVASIGAWA